MDPRFIGIAESIYEILAFRDCWSVPGSQHRRTTIGNMDMYHCVRRSASDGAAHFRSGGALAGNAMGACGRPSSFARYSEDGACRKGSRIRNMGSPIWQKTPHSFDACCRRDGFAQAPGGPRNVTDVAAANGLNLENLVAGNRTRQRGEYRTSFRDDGRNGAIRGSGNRGSGGISRNSRGGAITGALIDITPQKKQMLTRGWRRRGPGRASASVKDQSGQIVMSCETPVNENHWD